jgi:hypothetical protein
MEGGALNAGYTPVDALCHISNILGYHGLVYNEDWWWESFNRSQPDSRDWHQPPQSFGVAPIISDHTVNLRFKNKESIAFLKLHEMFKNLKEIKNDHFRC